MSPRTGRPKSDHPKGHQLHIRLHKETEEKLEHCAEVLETTKTAVIERGIELVEKEIAGKKK